MKRFAVILALALGLSFPAFSQNVFTHFGLEGGIAVNKFTDFQNFQEKGIAGWHAGMTLLTKLPGFFALQPTVEFERSCSRITLDDGRVGTMNIDAVDVPIAVQWGPDLGICRIFIEAVPYVGFNIDGKSYNKYDNDWENVKDYLKTTQFGLGVGGGLDVWRIQLGIRYSWAFGNWATMTSDNPFKDLDGKKKGITITLAYFFK